MNNTAVNDNDPNKPVAFYITGKGQDWAGDPQVLAATLRGCFARFEEGFGRLPEENESQMIWAAVQRYHGVPEQHIEPAEMRQQ